VRNIAAKHPFGRLSQHPLIVRDPTPRNEMNEIGECSNKHERTDGCVSPRRGNFHLGISKVVNASASRTFILLGHEALPAALIPQPCV
jgi:hypothetical protein